ncbi:MAG: Smr/MutS family protein, partial [Atribacterota bacterium]|nr:Smr/MutS family protein [Atribacterota bacterium]
DEQDYKDLIKLSQKDRLEKKAKFSNEIHVRHMTAAEAQTVLEKYLDDAFLLNVSPVYIVHGKGKGILRERVALLLRELNYVKSYRRGDYHEGGEGVTVVYF